MSISDLWIVGTLVFLCPLAATHKIISQGFPPFLQELLRKVRQPHLFFVHCQLHDLRKVLQVRWLKSDNQILSVAGVSVQTSWAFQIWPRVKPWLPARPRWVTHPADCAGMCLTLCSSLFMKELARGFKTFQRRIQRTHTDIKLKWMLTCKTGFYGGNQLHFHQQNSFAPLGSSHFSISFLQFTGL